MRGVQAARRQKQWPNGAHPVLDRVHGHENERAVPAMRVWLQGRCWLLHQQKDQLPGAGAACGV